ncbi:4-hydroxythreonine-4-phosphate dehydrogenase PdxA [Acidomonas methanolica]|uniref:4-hydroxythreonine-4-phosphate dehydrogenase n=2 Tax=Acidomonas methanolica TaxID=437 RepID=A0A023D762_ACIMT|nr:4-hydroxythreonine-4-phosphate dehydrogenase PdxA [Acidomonas methanolica]MBU2655708.1 4-hydroxythreonine-4-phosphate dehydrogenase PdxA [Acidomonas methanolica]TCS19737.1 4-hydroxythreonine-4-phosphate dehydrogenase [Acidomonas methanolica]GAJ30007.1 pyridoxal phosphate (vitamin B6) biosynthetic, 4-hydroxythreonine-4-phosphate dehydrogenase PdxA [Acidomonas methanolica NBRC 104435]GEL00644.1 4-hydroxythreonine-4-phosphate dehydrogenase [Acidomonas methanolica NBRC 104435]
MLPALTMGDPAGIGPELAVKAWRARSAPFLWIGDPALLAGEVPVVEIGSPEEAAALTGTALPVLREPLAVAATPGRPDPRNGAAVIASIRRATELALAGKVAGLVTSPISKHVLRQAGFPYPGHTEFLAALCDAPGEEVMMLASPRLRVVPVTVHVSLRHALDLLDEARIVTVGRIAARALRRDFGIAAPRLAVAGLNPHAGEEGLMGDEERRFIRPAVASLRAEGIDAFGPLPPDTLFTEAARRGYDSVLCMYHDQALIPLKTLDMAEGVNVTLGLPIIRTSPDHGTAFDIAGQDRADPSSLLAALALARDLGEQRRRFDAAQ